MATTKLTYDELNKNLEQFIGSMTFYRLGLTPIIATEGIKYFAETCECFWLMDEICINLYRIHQQIGTLFIRIEVNKRHTVHIIAEEDKGMPPVFDRKIRDKCAILPTGNYMFYLMNNTLLLPSEY